MRARILLMVSLALLTAACFAKKPVQKERYLLATPVTGARAAAPLETSMKLERVRVSPLYDSKGFVYRTGEQRYETDFYHEFYAAPGLVVEDVLLTWLREQGGFRRVRSSQDPQPARWLLAVCVDELYVDASRRGAPLAVVSMTVDLRDTRRGTSAEPVLSRRYTASSPIESSDARDVLDGWSRGLTDVLARIDADLRTTVAASGAS